ncbi:hypothetical protein Syun_001869 [Stephania yunnanensis]|uniref:Uncharacterized protein n=1 Tax=Stephania yunnanensis TaxID=152371 RepID=A0AAP0LKE8_9MAGN
MGSKFSGATNLIQTSEKYKLWNTRELISLAVSCENKESMVQAIKIRCGIYE